MTGIAFCFSGAGKWLANAVRYADYGNNVWRPSAEGKPPSTSLVNADLAAVNAGTTASPAAIRAASAAASAHPVPCGSPLRVFAGGTRVIFPSEAMMSTPLRPFQGKWPPFRTTPAPVDSESVLAASIASENEDIFRSSSFSASIRFGVNTEAARIKFR